MKWLEFFEYKNGALYWKLNKGPLARKGGRVGSGGESYDVVTIDGESHLVHRIVWEMHYGEIPPGMCIDHINGVRSDNEIGNLRVVTVTENNRNKRLDKRNRIGIHGVYWESDRKRYKVSICDDGRWKHVGRFENLDDAIIARKNAEKKLGYHQNHGSELKNG